MTNVGIIGCGFVGGAFKDSEGYIEEEPLKALWQ